MRIFVYKIEFINEMDSFWLIDDLLSIDEDTIFEFIANNTYLIISTHLSNIEIENFFDLYDIGFKKLAAS